jgi:glycine dehydrogenase
VNVIPDPVSHPITSDGPLRLGDVLYDDFVARHIGVHEADLSEMCRIVGVADLDDLAERVLPVPLAEPQDGAGDPELPPRLDEKEMLATLRDLAARNNPRTSLIGMGYYGTRTPPVIQRNVLEDPRWYTSYTPYQPEISQGRLEALLNFQTMVVDLTGLELANASLLDEATAAAEAMTMARRLVDVGDTFFVHEDTHPQTIAVLRTRAMPVGISIAVGDHDVLVDIARSGALFGALHSNPTSSGAIVDLGTASQVIHESGAISVAATDLLACTLVRPPGEMGVDIAVGSAQRFGVPMAFGGPHAAFIACRSEHARSLPGRLVGVSADTEGRPALRLALQTREQHIRRERATSNICTAQALLANISGFYAIWHGPDGLRRIAHRVHGMTSVLAERLGSAGHRLRSSTWFDTISVDPSGDTSLVPERARELGIDLREHPDGGIGISLDETSGVDTIGAVLHAFGVDSLGLDEELGRPLELHALGGLARTTGFLDADVFHRYRTEHEMLRYIRRLADRDLALDRTMIPLGSCTMKLNATVEMLPVTWPEFTTLHPYAPDDESEGTRALIRQLEHDLCVLTGYDAVSLQPNAGSQGEFAGLLAIRAYHESRNDGARSVCLIPQSAHGTNAASAVMAGMDVVVVRTNDRGDVDLDHLRTCIDEVGDRLAAIMVTYPSTHGVFEPGISDICRLVHDAGGQVYVDGANLNALVGLARPGKFGADVSHLNLHKTFCIPHGGGGPGVGPVAVRAHLAPFLPGHPLAQVGTQAVGPVSAAPYGSAGVLPISWAYIRLMGLDGLRRATLTAILAANYVANRLEPHFPVLFRGPGGFVAHECILDLRPLTRACGVTVDDVAKRLIDHGFHAPTVSFPVAGTLMVEPTESESLTELERFCAAMIAIRHEITEIEDGLIAMADSPLRHAPHTAADLLGEWSRAYSPAKAAFPLDDPTGRTYFPPVARVDAAFGDRNLVCTCLPLEQYKTP